MPLSLEYIDKKFDSVYEKLDEINDKVTALELKTCRKVDRNSFILNGMLWFIGIVVAANIVAWVRYLW